MSRLQDIVGQSRAVETLRRTISADRLASGYLFSGPEGVGKTAAAVALASALNCDVAPGDGCNDCRSCSKINAGLHPDLTIVAAEGAFIKIEQVRLLQQQMAYPPNEGRRRVIIIDGAHKLNLNAANALLKSVEEPRADTVFVLVSSAAHQVIPTLRSRCQRIRFGPLQRDQVAAVVARHTDADATAQQNAVAVAEGSPGRALRLLQSEQLELARGIMEGILTGARAQDGSTVFEIAGQVGREREPILEAFELLRVWLRDLLLLCEGTDPRRLINVAQLEQLQSEADRLDRRTILARLRALQRAQSALLGNANPRLTLETLMLQLR